MTGPKGTPSLPPEQWPVADIEAFEQALRPKRFRRGGGTASHLRPATVRGYRWAYGRWLRFLLDHAPETLLELPADRLTEERMVAFVDELAQSISSRSVWSYISKVHNTAYCIFPEHDWLWLREMVNLLHEMVLKDGIDETKLVGIEEIYALGLQMMDQAAKGLVKQSRLAPHYRNGLLLALGAETLLRPGNLTTLRIGRQLIKPSSRWQIVIPAEEVKNGKRIDQALTEHLSKAIDLYLEEYRPQLLCSNQSDLMWINHEGREMKPHAVGQRVVKVTLRYLGKAIAIQRFRNCAATSIAVRKPELAGITPALLAHHNGVTYQQHYNRASQTSALSRYHEDIKALLLEDEPPCAP